MGDELSTVEYICPKCKQTVTALPAFKGMTCLRCTGHANLEEPLNKMGLRILSGDIPSLKDQSNFVTMLHQDGLADDYKVDWSKAKKGMGTKVRQHLESVVTVVYDNNTNKLSFGGESFTAHNNVDSSSKGPWPNGKYPLGPIVPKSNDDQYGNVANVHFKGVPSHFKGAPDRTCMGIHSGRQGTPDKAGRKGTKHCTFGCIRTTDEAVKKLVTFVKSRKDVHLIVKNNESNIAEWKRRAAAKRRRDNSDLKID